MPTDDGKAPDASSTDKARRKNAILRAVLMVLIGVAAILGVRALGMWRDVVECERIFRQADAEMDRKQWDEALVSLDRCIALNSLYFPAYEARSFILLEVRNDKQGALATLTGALPHLEHDPRLHRALGELYLRNLGNPVQAQAHLAKACALDPEDEATRGLLARVQSGASVRDGSKETR